MTLSVRGSWATFADLVVMGLCVCLRASWQVLFSWVGSQRGTCARAEPIHRRSPNGLEIGVLYSTVDGQNPFAPL